MVVAELLLLENGSLGWFKEHVDTTKHHERHYYLLVVALLKSMHQHIVSDIPDEGEERVILFVVHRILDLRVIKRQFGLHLYEAVLKPQRSKPLRF